MQSSNLPTGLGTFTTALTMTFEIDPTADEILGIGMQLDSGTTSMKITYVGHAADYS